MVIWIKEIHYSRARHTRHNKYFFLYFRTAYFWIHVNRLITSDLVYCHRFLSMVNCCFGHFAAN